MISFDELERVGSRPLHGEKISKMAASSSKTPANMSYFVPIEDALGLLDSGLFDCDEEIIQQVNSLESDVSFFEYLCVLIRVELDMFQLFSFVKICQRISVIRTFFVQHSTIFKLPNII